MKLNTERCRKLISQLRFERDNGGMSNHKFDYLDALEIALPILGQQERGDGWIEWGGGKRPVISGKQVEVKFRGGEGCIALSGQLDWRDTESCGDIIAYRIIPEQPTNQNGEQ